MNTIYLFILFDRAGSLLLHEGFVYLGRAGGTLLWCGASHMVASLVGHFFLGHHLNVYVDFNKCFFILIHKALYGYKDD